MSTDGYVTMDDGVRLFVQTVGNGPKAVVILNGFYLFDVFKRFADGRSSRGAWSRTSMIWTPSAVILASIASI
jgi:hypothetical protein